MGSPNQFELELTCKGKGGRDVGVAAGNNNVYKGRTPVVDKKKSRKKKC